MNFHWRTIVLNRPRTNISLPIRLRQMDTLRLMCNWNRYGQLDQTSMWFVPGHVKYYSKDSEEYGKQLGGFEYKDEVEGFRSPWRKPIAEKMGFWKSKLGIFGDSTFPADLIKLNPDNFKYMSFKRFWRKMGLQTLIFDQAFKQERITILGCDLAAAHFTVFRGGAVKFYHQNTWIKDDKKKMQDYDDDLPNSYNPDYVLEGIDLSGTKIIYEGLRNIEDLTELKWLSFASCPLFDDFCLDRVTGEFGETLEYLDISYTPVSHHGLNALYRLQNIKTLKVNGFQGYNDFWLTCQELKKAFPNLKIEGISDECPLEVENKMLQN